MKSISKHLKYHMDETDTFRELYATREKIKVKFVKADRELLDKKEKLFK